MRIAFGWYSFKLKTYKSEDLQIPEGKFENVTFEVRQKCFHLMYIPFFSIGKMYAMRKEGQLYEMPGPVERYIKEHYQHRTPWYAFALPILAIVGFVLYMASAYYHDYQYDQYNNMRFNERVEVLTDELNQLTKHSFIEVKNVNEWHADNTYLKVIHVQDTTIRYALLQSDLSYDVKPYQLLELYQTSIDSIDTLTIGLNRLNQAVCTDYNVYKALNGYGKERADAQAVAGVALFTGSERYLIEDVERIDGPAPEAESFRSSSGGNGGSEVNIGVVNYGAPATLVKVENIKGNYKWDKTVPEFWDVQRKKYILSEDEYRFIGKSEGGATAFEVLLTFQDTLGQTYQFSMKQSGHGMSIERNIH